MKENKVEKLDSGAKIWEKIQNCPLEMFGLANQTVLNWVKHIPEMNDANGPGSLFVTLKASAVLPELEQCLQKIKLAPNERFEVTQVDKYTVIKVVTR